MESSKDLNTNRTIKSSTKSTWGQRALNKSASSNKANSSVSGPQSSISDDQKNQSNKAKNSNESNTTNSNKVNLNNSNQLNSSGSLKPSNNVNNNNSNNLNVLTTNKIPHPPPQTKPTTSSARKIRLTSAVKANNLLEHQNVQLNTSNNNNKPKTAPIKKLNIGGELSSNEEDIHNNSSKTLLDFNIDNNYNLKQTDSPPKIPIYSNTNYLNDSFSNTNDLTQSSKLKDDNQQSSSKLTDPNNTPYLKNTDIDLDGSNNSMVYSFSSRPKPVIVTNKESNTSTSINTNFNNNGNNSNKSYDYRKYTSSIKKLPIQSNSSLLITNPNKIEASIQFKDSLNISESNNLDQAPKNIIEANKQQLNYDVIDSFEARMLEEMKAEMDSNHNSNNSKKSSNNSNGNKNQVNTSKLAALKNMNGLQSPSSKSPDKEKHKQITNLINEHNYKLNQRSPDAEFIESLQREASGIQSPMSDVDNHTTSEKYNFEAMTSSIDDTTTSISRRPSNMKTALDEINIYQEEMNVSLHTNIQTKSINYK